MNNTVHCGIEAEMAEKSKVLEEKKEGFGLKGCESEDFVNVFGEEWRESSSSSDLLVSEATMNEENGHSSSEESSLNWARFRDAEKTKFDGRKLEKQGSSMSGTN